MLDLTKQKFGQNMISRVENGTSKGQRAGNSYPTLHRWIPPS